MQLWWNLLENLKCLGYQINLGVYGDHELWVKGCKQVHRRLSSPETPLDLWVVCSNYCFTDNNEIHLTQRLNSSRG